MPAGVQAWDDRVSGGKVGGEDLCGLLEMGAEGRGCLEKQVVC